MHDQADELRQLVLRTAATARIPSAPPPPLVAVSGGKGGVGSTTVAVNLAIVLARLGRRAVLVDADLNQPDATAMCQIKETDTVADVLQGRRTVHEVMQPGPGGIQVLPGVWAPDKLPNCSPMAQQRMLTELGRLGPHADVIVLDVGNKPDGVSQRFWQAADLVLLVTTGDAAAIMDSYAAVKLLAPRDAEVPRYATVVNRAVNGVSADEVHARIRQACQRFLNLEIASAPHVPDDAEVNSIGSPATPFVLRRNECRAARAIEEVAEFVLMTLGVGTRQRTSALWPNHRAGVA